MSVRVEFDPWGRTGNRLFQYVFGKILATNKSVDLFCDAIPNFNINEHLCESFRHDITTKSHGNNSVDIEQLNEFKGNILVNSFLQKAYYYIPYRKQIKQWLNVNENTTPINSDSLVIHIRETDYKDIGVFLGYDYYRALIDSTGFTNIIIVTDNSNCETVQQLLNDGCTLSTAGYVDVFSTTLDDRGKQDFNTLLNSAHIVLSQSSFSWWAAFLGDHETIIFPYTTQGKSMWPLNPGKDDVDLYFNFGVSSKFIL